MLQVAAPIKFDKNMVGKASKGLDLIRRKQITKETYLPRRVDNVFTFLASVVNFYGEQMARLNIKVKIVELRPSIHSFIL